MTVWIDCNNKKAFGIAKCNFEQENKPHRLSLDVGDAVVILKETTHWYYGYKQRFKDQRGIFPKTYIHLCDFKIVNDEYCIQRSEIVEEITTVLLEWGSILKQYFLATHPDFPTIRAKMTELNNNRALLISGNLPVDEMRKVKLMATSQIDTGNSLLGLDMVVRDESGDILDSNTICTTDLYEHHLTAVDRIIKANRSHQAHRSSSPSNINRYSHNILLHVNAFVCKFQEDSDLLFTLFDGESHKPISENYLVKWSKTGIARDIEQIDSNRVLFTDLSKNDLSIPKMYLVCYAIRIGGMEMKEDSKRTSITNSVLTAASKKHSQLSISSSGSYSSQEYIMRRPFGVACKDLTPFLNKQDDFKGNLDLPFILCDKDNMDNTLRKLIANKDMEKIDSKIAVTLEVLRGDVKQIQEDFPRLVHPNIPTARKMGFPEVILPGDVRNDLYITLVSGEFARVGKTSEKNVEVTVCVCNEDGQIVPGVISIGAGHSYVDEYKSVVYYHEGKPKWLETFKIDIPIEEFKQCHLRLMYKHRSSNEQKDKCEKPFALSYVKLMQENGTTILQGQHHLTVYKIDHKKFEKNNAKVYMQLPSTTSELNGCKPSTTGLALSPKDQLTICVNLCSTKLTQSVSLLGLLKWADHKDTLEQSLHSLTNVPGEEVVKFLQDILDALFNILTENDNPERYDQLVFMSIIHLIETVYDMKYQHFLSVLDVYINNSFSATLAYGKLIDVLKRNIREAVEPKDVPADGIEIDERVEVRHLYKTTKYLHYVMKFVIRSRILFTEINGNFDDDDFATKLHELLEMFIRMIACPTDLLKSEGALLKNLHIIAQDLMQVFDPVRLSIVIVNILKQFPPKRLTQSKMVCIKDFVDSKLFLLPECRAILLPVFCNHIKDRLESREEGDTKSDIWQQEKNLSKAARILGQLKSQLHTRETTAKQKVTECINIMNNILKLLYRKDIGPTHNDVRDIMLILLRTVIKTSQALDRENQLVGNLVAIMLGIIQRMDSRHYDIFVRHLDNRYELRDFIIEILLVFEELVSPHQKPVFPRDWMDMIMHQNTVILGALQHLSMVITDYYFNPFEKQVWSNFFQCSIAFLIQTPLQLSDINDKKRHVIFARYRDIRKDTAKEIRKMWFQLGEHKPKFVPQLVEPILEMSMIPEVELRKATIPIFFDMMQCEYYSSKMIHDSYGDTKRNKNHYKANFNDFETEMIEKLDILIGTGKGDLEYKELFEQIMLESCQAHNILNVEGTKFVNMVTKLMDRLLEYRCIIQDESKENRMACTFSLLQFYCEVKRREMYIRYVYKLCDLHMEFDNYTEAAFTLKLHTELLSWDDTELSPLLRSHRHMNCRTHRELKEALYYEIINYFDKGKMWECAIEMCKILADEYENQIFDYLKLSILYKKMAEFFEKILKEMRHSSTYFRVAFYGLGFPRFLQNKVYIYRGKEYERLGDFQTRILIQHPQAELMNTLEAPDENLMNSDSQYIQINKVDPIMDRSSSLRFNDKGIANEIVKYYMFNNVQMFEYSRPFRESIGGDADDISNLWLERTIIHISYPLPGILRWFPEENNEKFKISPIEMAIETMTSTNKAIRDLIIAHRSDETLSINPLTMKLSGIVDPAVMGGFSKYEEAFLVPEYLENHPDHSCYVEQLKDLIASQIPLLEIAITLHKQKAPESLKKLNEHLEKTFAAMQANVEGKYGKRSCDLKFDRDSVILRRNNSLLPFDINNRLSETSMGSSDSGLSKSTSSRPQTSSIKSTFAGLSFNPRNSHGSSPSSKGKLKEKSSMKKRSMKKDRETLNLPVTNSQWYASPLTTITSTPEREINNSVSSIASVSNTSLATPKTPDPRVLTEELTPKRPLRSEKDKERRLSRPASIATPTASMKNFSTGDTYSLSGADSSNRNSVDTTDSTSEEEKPPPLPAKARDSTDFTCMSSDWNPKTFSFSSMTSTSSIISTNSTCITNSNYEYVETKNFIFNEDIENRPRPPTPPPKPARQSKHIP